MTLPSLISFLGRAPVGLEKLGCDRRLPVDPASLEVLALLAHHPQHLVVDVTDVALPVAEADADQVGIGDATEPRFADRQRDLDLLAVTDIDAGPDVAGKTSARVETWHTGIQDPAVLPRGITQPVLNRKAAQRFECVVVNVQAALRVVRMNVLGPALAEFLVDGPTNEIEPDLVEPGALAVGPADPHHHRRGIGHQAEALFALAQSALGALARGDVEGEAARVHEAAVFPVHAGADQHVANRAVLAAQACGALVQVFAGSQAVEDRACGVGVDMKFGDIVADDLFGAVAEHLQFGPVDADDPAVRAKPVHADGRVLEEIDQLAFAARQPLLGFAPNRHIAEHQHDADDVTAAVAYRRGAVVDGPLASVAADQHRVVGQSDDLAELQDLFDRIVDRLARVLVDDAEDLGERTPGSVLV